MSLYRLSNASLRNRDGVDDRLIDICDIAIELTPIDFGIPKDGGLRSADRQQELYISGASRCDGYISKSLHQDGFAIDFFGWINGAESYKPEHMAMIGASFLQAAAYLKIPARWGGFFKPYHPAPYPRGWDMGHVELII